MWRREVLQMMRQLCSFLPASDRVEFELPGMSLPSDQSHSTARGLRRLVNRILAVLLTALLVSIVCWRVIIASQVNSRLRRIKASGYPSSPQELNAWYKAVPEGDNAALT